MDTMRRISFFICILGLVSCSASTVLFGNSATSREHGSRRTETSVVQDMIARRFGAEYVEQIELSVISPLSNGSDVFRISSSNTSASVKIEGSSGVALSSGIYWYMKYVCNVQISWGRNGTGNQLHLPPTLPSLPDGTVVEKVRVGKYSYYQNVCTVSYSMSWWNWARWEEEIDWMALNGINLPLAFVGQEYVWQQLWQFYNLTAEDISSFFSGPAFLAWNRMGNIKRWANPLTQYWIEEKYKLQLQILDRMRAFGMKPVLPCFAGHVPDGLNNTYPNASITPSALWGGFDAEYSGDALLDPADPLFAEIAQKFIELQQKAYGSDHIYQCDTFNEMRPKTNDTGYLAAAAAAVAGSIQAADPDGIWLMQGWLFLDQSFWNPTTIKAYLYGVPDASERLVILDLFAEVRPQWQRTQSFFGIPYIWCMLHNFGGNRDVYGTFDSIRKNPAVAYNAINGTMIGTGMTPEAIEHNPVIYEMMSEMTWRQEGVVDLSDWLTQYSARRYGAAAPSVLTAWEGLSSSSYGGRYQKYEQSKSYITRQPALEIGGWMTGDGSNATLYTDVWRNFVAGWIELPQPLTGTYLYDLVDISARALDNIFVDLLKAFKAATDTYTSEGFDTGKTVSAIGKEMLRVISEEAELLATNPNYLLGPWIETAKEWAADASDESLLEFNARNQVTMWGPDGEINDYAGKHWDGLFRDYYYGRWELFISTWEETIAHGQQWNESTYEASLLEFEKRWNHDRNAYPTIPSGHDAVDISESLIARYATDKFDYVRVPLTDAGGNDLYQAWNRDIPFLMYLCSSDPSCAGFNTNGWLKSDIGSKIHNPVPPCDLYVKVRNTA